jgi:hypothetical protein
MKNVLVVGCLFTFVTAGCAPVLSAAAAPTDEPGAIPTPRVELMLNPPPCGEADLIYHSRFKQMLLVNCVGDPSKMTLLTIWQWDGTRWDRVTQDGPPGRILGAAAYDDRRDVLVLYGGRPVELGMCSQETWEWDGEFWEQMDAQPPTACVHMQMVYDPSTRESVLFSGLDPSENPVKETWSWNGNKWELLSQEGPESRGHFGMVYDPSQKQILLYGGFAGTTSDEFWVWKENGWEEIDFQSPGPLSHFGMTVDTDTDALYIFGGAASGSTLPSLTNKMWVLQEGHWKELRPTISPSARGGPAMAYDPVRKRIVLYGGFDAEGNKLNDTWEWDGQTWTCLMNCD